MNHAVNFVSAVGRTAVNAAQPFFFGLPGFYFAS
jgi:hypothetical protein